MVCELYLNTAVFLKTYTSQKVDEFSEDAEVWSSQNIISFFTFLTFTIFPHRRQFLENIFKKCGWRKGVMGEAGSGGWQPEGELP